MENATLLVGPSFVGDRTARTRITAIVAAVLLVLALFVAVEQTHVSPAGAAVTATASVAGVDAQINVASIACPILFAVRNAFAGTPFGSFVTPILNAIIRGFGCAPS
jgi:hypothetical protein